MPGRPRPKREAKAPARRKTALELRIEGLTFEAIGARMKITRQGAHKLVMTELAALAQENREAAEHLRDVEMERCHFVMRSMTPRVELGDPQAAMAYLRAGERLSKLFGLDAVARHDLTSNGEKLELLSDEELDRRLAELARELGLEPKRNMEGQPG